MTIVIETPKGSHEKFRFDAQKQMFVVNKVLPEGLVFPYDFGFVPGTTGDDGDPLDALVMSEWTHSIGATIQCRLVGCLPAEQTQDGQRIRNDRFLAVPDDSVAYADVVSIEQVDARILDTIESFFTAYLSAEGKKVEFLKRLNSAQAEKLLQRANSHPG